MTVGFVLSAPDNDSYMLRGTTQYPACSTCGLVCDREWIDPAFEVQDTRFDASYTYDGYLIVSERFRAITDTPGAHFIDLPSSPGFYSLVIANVVPFDAVRRKTLFEQPCEECDRFFVVAGAKPAFVMVSSALADRLYRTDVEFGTGNEQHPLVVMGPGLAARLRKENLTGVHLQPVEGKETS
jgi:hypothetical protein